VPNISNTRKIEAHVFKMLMNYCAIEHEMKIEEKSINDNMTIRKMIHNVKKKH